MEEFSAEALDTVKFPMTTVSLNLDFQSYIFVSCPLTTFIPVMFDTGNTMLVVPSWESITLMPDWQNFYKILAPGQNEPFGCPANIVQGPVGILTADGSNFTLEDCIFYACTDDYDGCRTANFGAGLISPQNQPYGMLTPLQYNSTYPYAEISLAPAQTIFGESGELKVALDSSVTLYEEMPAGYDVFDIIPNLDWMSLIPKSLTIGGTKTNWPGLLSSPVAFVDTGGGPVPQVPGWASSGTNCNATQANLTIELGDANASMSYEIDTSLLPEPVRGLTLVMCQKIKYMEGNNGMNIGGLSALFLDILIDYQNARVGLKLKNP